MSDSRQRLTSITDESGDYGRAPDYSRATGPAACAKMVVGKSSAGASAALTAERAKVVPAAGLEG